ncbi:MAG: hypothetical protein KDK33_15785, partial [Leptospiraceae bacterium]|nr:hypothetical protein [Leptospiraceae bacterium]
VKISAIEKRLKCLLLLLTLPLFGCQNEESPDDYILYHFVDESGLSEIDSAQDFEWIPSITDSASFGISEGTIWQKIEFKEEIQYQYIELRYPLLDSIDIYFWTGESFFHMEGGDVFAYGHRPIDSNSFIFPIREKSEGPIYVRVHSTSALLATVRLYTEGSLRRTLDIRHLLYGVYFGFLLIMAVYNAFLSLSIKDFTYGLYSAYVFSALLTFFTLEGYSYRFIWQDSIGWNNVSFIALSSIAYFLGLEFTKRYLGITRKDAVMRFFSLSVLQIILLVLGVSVVFVSYRAFSSLYNLTVMIASIMIIASAFYSVRQGNRSAKFFFYAWVFFMAGMISLTLKFAGVLPDSDLIHSLPYLGSAIEVSLLSLGLGDRFNQQKEESLNQQISLSNSYARFVPKQFLTFLNKDSITDVQLGNSVQKEMTVLFSDIRSFTTLSESMTPQENFDFINALLKRIGPVIRQNNGFIDKYIGDAIMALFPDIPDDAVRASIEIRRLLAVYNQRRASKGMQTIRIGIGMHTGNLMLGTIGEEERMEGTVISDNVNLASRLEGLSQKYGVTTIISEKTLFGLSDPSKYNYRIIDYVRVKGKSDTVSVTEIFDGDPSEQLALKLSTRGKFERAMNFYLDRDFESALTQFQAVLEINPEDSVATLHAERIKTFQNHGLPPDWDGVAVMGEK